MLFYVAYVAIEIPSNLVMKKIGSIWLAIVSFLLFLFPLLSFHRVSVLLLFLHLRVFHQRVAMLLLTWTRIHTDSSSS